MTRSTGSRLSWPTLLTCGLWPILSAAAPAPVSPVASVLPVVGVVQEAKPDSGTAIGLRVLFRRASDGWQSVCPPGPAATTCVFPEATGDRHWFLWGGTKSGKSIVTHGILEPGWLWSTGLLRIVSGLPPVEGPPTTLFAGWSGDAVHKPLVVTDKAGSGRLLAWRATKEQHGDLAAIWSVFSRSVPKVEACDKPSQPIRPTRRDDVHITDTLVGPGGALLVHAAIRQGVLRCDGVKDMQDELWIYKAPGQPLRALPHQSGPTSLTPLAFGDFGDGGSEALFFFSANNSDGFLLFSDDFSKTAETGWSFH